MSFNRDLKLEFLYESMFKGVVLPPGISDSDIYSIEEYNEEICGKTPNLDSEIKEAEETGIDKLNPRTGADIRDVPEERMKEILSKRAEREKLKAIVPHIHRNNIVDENGVPLDLDVLRKQITKRPREILTQNEKLKKSSGQEYMVYNINLPAFTGLYVDEKSPDKQFKILRTCPSAGKCVNFCYARKGSYIMFPAVNMAQSRNLNFLMNDWEGFKQVLTAEIFLKNAQNRRNNTKTVIRWHDSGDFFSDGYLEIAFQIAKETPSVIHYAYTKEFEKFNREDKPNNFVFNISAGGKADEVMDIKRDKSSEVIQKELFEDLLSKEKGEKWNFSEDDIKILKNRVSEKFGIQKELIITYDELLKIPYDPEFDTERKWFVLVWPGHGDQSAFRKDVQSTLLLIH
jgi:hypothetical protein